VIIERHYTTQPVHQAYIEPHACVVSVASDGAAAIWASSQGQFMIRAYCSKLLGMDMSSIRVMPAEIGGGFGGKTSSISNRSPWRCRKRPAARSRS